MNERKYEFLIISKNQDVNALEKFTNYINENGGTVEKVDEWGKKKLAYPIQDLNEAYFFLIQFTYTSKGVRELSAMCRIDENVLRNVIIPK